MLHGVTPNDSHSVYRLSTELRYASMPTKTLNLRLANSAVCPPGKSQEFFRDTKLSNFVLVVTPKGKKRWAYQYRVDKHGSLKQITIGHFPPLHPVEARLKAEELARKVQDGVDPQAERERERVRRRSKLIETVWPEYIAFLNKGPDKRGPRSPEHIINYQGIFRKYLEPQFAGMPIDEIRTSEVKALLREIDDDETPSVPSALFTCLRAFLNWARSEEIIEHNPIAGMGKPKGVKARTRTLSDEELRNLWRAIGSLPLPQQNFVKMLLLTGARRSNLASGFRWGRLNRSEAHCLVPAGETKSRKTDLAVFLSPPAIAILDEMAGGQDWPSDGFVFSINGRTTLNGFSKLKIKIDKLCTPSIDGWVFHDLRRTFATGLQRLQVPLHITELCLHHQSGSFGGIVGTYQTWSHEPERRQAMEKWGDYITEITKGLTR